MSELRVDGLHWTLATAGERELSPGSLRFSQHEAQGCVTIVKHGAHRTVYRVELPTGPVYWKHCRLNGPRAWCREVLRGPKAKLEFDRARRLTELGIDTIEPLAWAKFDSLWPKGSFIITRSLEGTISLEEHLTSRAWTDLGERIRLTQALARFVAKLHDAGVTHPDLHPGNLLIEPDSLRFFLIDVHDLELGPPLPREARVANLAMLNRWFCLRSSRSDRCRFWAAYAGTAAEARIIETRTAESNASLWSSRDGRCLRVNRHFDRVRGKGIAGFAAKELPSDVREALSVDPDGPFARSAVVLLKNSRSATVCVLHTSAGTMIYKRFLAPDRTDALASAFRPSPARRSWMNGHALLDRGLPTPRPWLFLERRSLGLPTVGYLLCDMVSHAVHFHEAIAAAPVSPRRALIDRLARWLHLMHERGVSHRDLKAANILVDAHGDIHLIDLVGVRTRRRISTAIRQRDLMRLNASFVRSPHVSRTDRLRFLRQYRLWALRGSGDWHAWWKSIEQSTEAKVARNAQRNRPLA